MKIMKKATSVALAALMVAALTAGCGGAKKEAANTDEIPVGASFELTGNVANYGKSALSGFKMAVEEINKAGGINGKKIRVVESDNKSEPSEAGNAVPKLLPRTKLLQLLDLQPVVA